MVDRPKFGIHFAWAVQLLSIQRESLPCSNDSYGPFFIRSVKFDHLRMSVLKLPNHEGLKGDAV